MLHPKKCEFTPQNLRHCYLHFSVLWTLNYIIDSNLVAQLTTENQLWIGFSVPRNVTSSHRTAGVQKRQSPSTCAESQQKGCRLRWGVTSNLIMNRVKFILLWAICCWFGLDSSLSISEEVLHCWMRCGSPIDRFSLVISVVQEANFNEHLWKSNVLWSGQENMPSRHCRPMVLWKLFNWMVWDWDLWIKRVVSDIDLALGHIDSLSQKGDVALVIHLEEKQCTMQQEQWEVWH